MKTCCCAIVLFLSAAASAMPLGTNSRAVIPSDIQQIISVDYRALKNSETAQALKQQVLPENLKQFEGALKGVGIDPEKELEQLTFASYRARKNGVQIVGIAQGQFPTKMVLKRMRVKKIKPTKYHSTDLYPMGNGMLMTFLDDSTLAFGNQSALTYNANGQPTTHTAPGGVTVSNTYNSIGNLTGQTGSGADAATTARSFDYDTAGRLTSAAAPGGTDTFTLDDRGLLLSATGPSGNRRIPAPR